MTSAKKSYLQPSKRNRIINIVEGNQMSKRAKRVVSILLKGALIGGLLIALPVIASMALSGSSDAALLAADSPFATYTIVDPGNGENGVDVLTWDQIKTGSLIYNGAYVNGFILNIGDTVIIKATESPARNTRIYFYGGWNNKKDEWTGAKSVIAGTPGVIYENVSIKAVGDIEVRDLSVSCTFGESALSFGGATDNNTSNHSWYYAQNFYYQNYHATLTVTGDCYFETTWGWSSNSAVTMPRFVVKDFTIDGTGTLRAKGQFAGFSYNYGEYEPDRLGTAVITIDIPVVFESFGYGSETAGFQISGSSGASGNIVITGSGSLDARVSEDVYFNPEGGYIGFPYRGFSMGDGIFYRGTGIAFIGDLKINVKGEGISPGFDYYSGSSGDIIFDLIHDAVFESGDGYPLVTWGSVAGLFINNFNTTINIINKGTGNIVFRGGANHGYGIVLTGNNAGTALINTGTGRFIISGGGNGSGIYLAYNMTLDISGLNYDLELFGGETAPARQSAPALSRVYMCSAGLSLGEGDNTVILGGNNLLARGGANGGAGVDTGISYSLTVESTGGQIYALGGKGAFGNGLFLNSGLRISGNGIINAYGGYNNAGAQIGDAGNGSLTLGSGITLNALGGAKAPDVRGTIVR